MVSGFVLTNTRHDDPRPAWLREHQVPFVSVRPGVGRPGLHRLGRRQRRQWNRPGGAPPGRPGLCADWVPRLAGWFPGRR
jgi:hypothetical protein